MTDQRSQKQQKVPEQQWKVPEPAMDDRADRLEAIDYVLINESMIPAPMGFADRVIAAIAAGVRPSSLHSTYRGVRLALGLALTVVFIAPLVILMAVTLGHWLADPNAFGQFVGGLVDQIILVLDRTVQLLSSSLQTMTGIVGGIKWLILGLALPTAVIWLWTMWNIRRGQVVYRIPVQVL